MYAALKASYHPNFDVEHHSYNPEEIQGSDFKKIITDLFATGKPLLLLVTQKEGQFLSLATDPSCYLRVDMSNGRLAWSTNSSDPFAHGGQIWGNDFVCVHMHMQCTHFYLGPEPRLLPLDFLQQVENLLGTGHIPWDGVVLAGGWNDLKFFSNNAGKRLLGEETHCTDTLSKFNSIFGRKMDAFGKMFRRYQPNVELIVVGTG
jgi:hypothetical protein